MELPISIPCPNCSVKLRIKDAALFGRSLKCPKCGESFTARAPAEPEDEGYGIAEEKALPPLPPQLSKGRAKSKTAKKKSKKPAKTKSSGKTPLLIAGGGAGGLLPIALFRHSSAR